MLTIMKISPAKINSLLWIEKAAILPVVLAASESFFFSMRMCCIHRQIKSKQDCDILQDYLDKLAAWEKKWGMACHSDKCSAIRISRSRNPHLYGLFTERAYLGQGEQGGLYQILRSGAPVKSLLEPSHRSNSQEGQQHVRIP